MAVPISYNLDFPPTKLVFMGLHQPILEHSAVRFRTCLLVHLLTYVQLLPRLDIDIRCRVCLFDWYVIEHHRVGLSNCPFFRSLSVLPSPFRPDR